MTFDPDDNEPDDPAWIAEQRELAGQIGAALSWEDLCIRRGDPCDLAFWAQDFDL